MSDFWDTDRLLWLRERWEGGGSPSDMAREVGVSRNVIIGKIHRLQAKGELSYRADSGKPQMTRAKLPPSPRPPKPVTIRSAVKAAKAGEPVFDAAIGKTLEDLTKADCKWPVGDPLTSEFRYCGRARFEGSPYCEGHTKMSYQPRSPRKHRRDLSKV